MEKLIAVEELVVQAKKKGINLGKGNPYNRLRYYTKMGWLPNMKRKMSKGHYPAWVVDRLSLIEKLKGDRLTNEEITKRLSIESENRFSISNARVIADALATLDARVILNVVKDLVLSLLKSSEFRHKALLYSSFALVLLVVASELGVVKIGKTKNATFEQNAQAISNQILATGNAFIPAGQRRIFVKNDKVHNTSKIYVSFSGDYFPASRFWVSGIETLAGFFVELDAPVSTDAEFNWWVAD